MPQVPFTAFYLGPLAVYPSKTGLVDPITGAPERGGNFAAGNYADISEKDATVWNQTYNPPVPLQTGRYRIVQLNPTSLAGYTGFGKPCAWAQGSTVAQVSIAATGFNYTPGTYTVSSTASATGAKATAQVVIGASGGIVSAVLLFGGGGFAGPPTTVPTFGLTELIGGAGASLLAQMTVSSNVVQTYDSSALAIAQPRGIQLAAATAAQITAGAFVVIQEEGIAQVLVTTATNNTTTGNYAAATLGSTVTVTTGTGAEPAGFLGTTLDIAAANTLIRVALDLAVVEG